MLNISYIFYRYYYIDYQTIISLFACKEAIYENMGVRGRIPINKLGALGRSAAPFIELRYVGRNRIHLRGITEGYARGNKRRGRHCSIYITSIYIPRTYLTPIVAVKHVIFLQKQVSHGSI